MDVSHMQPVDAADADARRTRNVYDVNASEKVEMRRCREEAIRKAIEVFRRVPIALASQKVRSPQVEGLLLERWQIARDLLRSYGALPPYATMKCRCRERRRFSLPRWLHRQCLDLPL
jgi:hypothetical protein